MPRNIREEGYSVYSVGKLASQAAARPQAPALHGRRFLRLGCPHEERGDGGAEQERAGEANDVGGVTAEP